MKDTLSSGMTTARQLLVAGAMVITSTSASHAQAAAAEPPPQIVVTSMGEVQVTPDRARVQVGVETEAPSAAAAAEENNRKQTAVIAAIRALGIPQRSISTVNYSVQPIQRWNEQLRRTELTGYRVSNVVQVEAEKIEQAGPIIDAGLKAGANRVAGLDFELANYAPMRDSALVLAVGNARRQAEVAARAAGGTIGGLLELTVMSSERPEPRPMAMAAMRMADQEATSTPISEGTMKVNVMVMTRWRFAPSR